LKEVAHHAAGTYIHYNRPGSVANGLVAYLNELEKSELEVLMRRRYKDRFMFFLIPAFLLLLIANLLGTRRRSWKFWRRGALVTLILLALSAGTGCDDAFQAPLRSIEAANALIAAGQYDEALAVLQDAEREAAGFPAYHYNTGLAHLGMGQFEPAREAFGRALATNDDALRFDVLYNMGLALSGEEKWQEAFDVKKDALGLAMNRPDIISEHEVERTRHNLEVILRNLHPPCANLEDEFEPNDTPEQATHLEAGKQEDMTLCGLNDDWFVVGAAQGALVSVKVKFKSLRDKPDPEHIFLPRPEDVHIAVFDNTGRTVIAVDQGLSQDEAGLERANRSERVEREIERFELTPEVFPTAEGPLFIKVMAAEGLEFKYDLEIDMIPPCHVLDDDYEPNGTAAQAKELAPGAHSLHICPDNEDWFRISVPEEGTFFVDIQPGEDLEREVPPELNLEIRDEEGRTVVARGAHDGTFLTAGLQDLEAGGEYLMRISGTDDDAQGPYQLTLYAYEACPEGDDYYSPNYHPALAQELEPQLPVHRYLRICEDTKDFFQIKPAEDGTLEWGLQRVDPLASTISPTGHFRRTSSERLAELSFDRVDETETIIQEGDLVEEVLPDGPVAAPLFAPMHRMLVAEELDEEESVMLRVEGSPSFYHLVSINPQAPPQEDQDEQEEEQDQEGDDEDQDGDEEDEDSSDENEDGDEEEDSQPEDGEDGDDDDADDEPSTREPQDVNVQHIDDILKALEESDDNFQLKKSLENMPKRYLDKDW
ncbi:MAG: tetratricopeptide repeat protein, partial [Bradymonadaceae bacterium]